MKTESGNNKVLYGIITVLAVLIGVQSFFIYRIYATRQASSAAMYTQVPAPNPQPSRVAPPPATAPSFTSPRITLQARQAPPRPRARPISTACFGSGACPLPPPPGIATFDPFGGVHDLFAEMDAMMDSMFQDDPFRRGVPGNGVMTFDGGMDIQEDKDAYVVSMDIPGLNDGGVDVQVDGRILTVSGTQEKSDRSSSGAQGSWQQHSYSSFQRSVALPGPVDAARVSSSYENGTLRVRVPRAIGRRFASS